MLDDLFRPAAEAQEPEDQNFIRKHALALHSQGLQNASARLFSNPAGDFGSLVNDQVVDGNWESGDELGDTWRDRNAFGYGRQDKGQARPEILTQLLKANGRGFWQPDEEKLQKLRELYELTDEQLEGVTVG